MSTERSQRHTRTTDFEEVLGILSASAQTIDDGDVEAWLDCYTDTGTFAYRPAEGAPEAFRLEGRDDRRQWFAQHRARLAVGSQVHVVANPRVMLDGDTAKGESTYFTLLARGDAIVVASSGRWLDRLVRDRDGRWRIEERTAVRRMPPG